MIGSMIHLNKLSWIEELLPSEVESKNVAGGRAYYFNEKKVMILTEKSKATEYKGKKYPFELWFGVFFPIEKIKQSTVAGRFPFLENHPGNKKALYLPAETEDFEDLIKSVLKEIFNNNPLFGEPFKETAAERRSRLNMLESEMVIDSTRPSLFNADLVVAKKRIMTKSKPNFTEKKKTNKKSENSMILEMVKRRG
jgi:hypothetical protein